MSINLRHLFIYAAAAALIMSCGDPVAEIAGGTYSGQLCDGVPSGYGTWQRGDTCYQGFWKDGLRHGEGLLKYGSFTYRGGFVNGLFEGTGVLACGDSIVYSGRWHAGKRHGTGTVTDSLGRSITATWRGDSLITGSRRDAGGTYSGTFDADLMPSGRGTYTYADLQFYDGTWKDDAPHGFGMQLAPDGWLRVGTWRKGKFRGEVLNYTADRIYGIDLSRYQHNAPIRWKELRITDLGDISEKKITGKVDYPVSYVYLKCTEGVTVLNSYYAADYSAAREHDIRCGAYHFFRVHTDAFEQAVHFLRHLRLREGDLAPVLDLEPSEKDIRDIGGSVELFKRVRVWLKTVEKKTGIRPVLYINQMFVNRHLHYAPDIEKNYDVWIARYGEYKPDLRLVHWQLAPDGLVRGIKGHVDINVFNGYRPAYDRYLRKKTYKNKMPDDKRSGEPAVD